MKNNISQHGLSVRRSYTQTWSFVSHTGVRLGLTGLRPANRPNAKLRQPLPTIAEYCHLSPTRFLHLFKERTNLSFRRYQLWNKLVKSLPYLEKNSVTDTAYAFGFSDNSHYTRTFIETFGVTPKFLSLKK